jgi:hypothetical protein
MGAVDLWSLSDLCTPWCLHVAATLRLADHIAAGTTTARDLAVATGSDASALARLLRHLVSKGLFEETSRDVFALNDAARPLLDAGVRLPLDLNGIGGRMANVWSSLPSAVRTGSASYAEVFGQTFWDDLQSHPEVGASFDAFMGPEGHGPPKASVLLDEDWSAIRTVVDVGGGTGALLAEVLRTHPDVTGTLIDLPGTIARAPAILGAAGVIDRVTLRAQSFFDPLPGGSDLYLLKSILSDWPDREAIAILTRCAEAARPSGRVVVLSGVAPDDGPPPPDLLMLVLVGGKDRTLAEFGALASQAGLSIRRAGRNASGRFIVECEAAER